MHHSIAPTDLRSKDHDVFRSTSVSAKAEHQVQEGRRRQRAESAWIPLLDIIIGSVSLKCTLEIPLEVVIGSLDVGASAHGICPSRRLIGLLSFLLPPRCSLPRCFVFDPLHRLPLLGDLATADVPGIQVGPKTTWGESEHLP
jgi:hypothetical protein